MAGNVATRGDKQKRQVGIDHRTRQIALGRHNLAFVPISAYSTRALADRRPKIGERKELSLLKGRDRKMLPGALPAEQSRASIEDKGKSIVDRVIVEFTAALKTGRFVPGQRLPETDLRELVSASRSSIREALRRLAADGLVTFEHQKGARVRRLSRLDTKEIYETRQALEGMAARLAARNVGIGDFRRRLMALEKEYDAAADGSAGRYLGYNEQFHRLIVEMSGNAHLSRFIEQLAIPAFLLLLQIMVEPPAFQTSRNEHRPIIKAIFAGDEDTAERAMRSHIARTQEHVLANARFSA